MGVGDTDDFARQVHCKGQVLLCKGQKKQQLGWKESSRLLVLCGGGQLHCQGPNHLVHKVAAGSRTGMTSH